MTPLSVRVLPLVCRARLLGASPRRGDCCGGPRRPACHPGAGPHPREMRRAGKGVRTLGRVGRATVRRRPRGSGTGGARHAATPERPGERMRLPNVMDEEWFPRRCLRCFFAIQGIDRATVIASQAFTALIPLVILTSALLPTENTRVHRRRHRAQVRADRRLGGGRADRVRAVGRGEHRRAQRAAAADVRRQPLPADPADVPRGVAAAAGPRRAGLALRGRRPRRADPRDRPAVVHPLAAARDPLRLGRRA